MYSLGEFSHYGVENLLRLFLLWYMSRVVGFDILTASLIVMMGIVWDAVSDPLMGLIADKYYLPFAGRHKLVFIGSVLTAIFIVIVFSSHIWIGSSFWGFLLLYMAMNTALTIFAVPFAALPGDFAISPELRTNIFAWRFGFGNIGSLLAAVLVGLLQANADGGRRFLILVLTYGFVALVVGFVSSYGTYKIEKGQSLKRLNALIDWRALRAVFQNTAFLPLLAGYLLANIGIGINSAAALFYYKDYLQISETETMLILATFFLVIVPSLVTWVKLSERFGKLKPLQIGSLILGVGTSLAYPLFPVGNFWWPLFIGGVGLGSMVGCVILLDSLLTDVADYGELKYGSATTALYFGVWKFAQKISRATAVGIAGAILGTGYQSLNANLPQELAIERLPWLFGPGVGGFLVLASVLMGFYRFDEVKQLRVRKILEKKQAFCFKK